MSELDKAPLLNGKIEVLSGFAFPSSGFNQLDGLPLIRIRDLGGSTTEVRFRGAYDPAYRVSKGDLLVGMDGDFEVYRWEGGDALLNQRVCKISSASREIDQGFLYWYLKPKIAEIHRRTPQTTVRHLSTKSLYAIAEPPVGFPKQGLIAQILDTLDTAIRETEVLIDKLKAVKQGLLHDLLTRGIDANGQLRPPQSEAPQLYKESPLGWIPREWEEVTLGKIASRAGGLLQTGPFGSQLHAHEYVADGIPVIMPQDMINGELSVESIARITQHKAVRLSRHQVRPNDLVFSRRGDLSRCVAIEDVHEGWLCGTGCLLARLPADEINGYWLSLVYQQQGVQSQVMGRAVGSTMANLNTSILAAIAIARPDIVEQNEIAKRLKSVGQRITCEERQLAKMLLEKSGLVDDLLTGRVRVTPLLESVQRNAAPTGA
ncbi:restriction endonuclease subunit S [Pseudomonas aeruginosa]|uniref:restriction endonuclease subunit S n=1 Tax=Pseudomonas aeruginosa TaxID=287 RepID=UPI000EB03F60|nr:restriction endonuclease subunit S [Pseudomonas aeruginosa]EME9746284.1 restriction endonuclease subunit S [Pseudomonas aeruginosa]MDY1295502.1 restriction endonuclease subunit S [Pseudomonas aeruginosa]MDY1391293.1 restriction endonuclease subunit S [Pseudomonas aeruginosa]TED53177.1 restriction endonuclease subunit S [Pseudomonas aeruginosa]UVW72665.1 restriction endonuclease subunit S [Pseudomonas aeruginosa]